MGIGWPGKKGGSGRRMTQTATPMTRIHIINFSRRFVYSSLFFFIPLHFITLGFSGWQIGVIVSLLAFAPLLFSFPTGWINDRLSIKRVIQGALGLMILLLLAIGYVEDFFAMAVLFLLVGVANNALEISANSYYYKDDTDSDLNRRFGVFNLWPSVGMALGALLGGILTHISTFKGMFSIFALYLLGVLTLTGGLPKAKLHAVSIHDYTLDLINRKTILFSILIFILALHWGAEGTVYTPFLKTMFHLNHLQMALYIAIPLFFFCIASLLVVFTRFDPRANERIFLFAMVISGAGHILMVSRSLAVSFLFRIIHEIGDGIMAAISFVFIFRLFEKRSIGGSSGILMAIMTLGHMAGAILFSFIGYYMDLKYPFIISGILLIGDALFGRYLFSTQEY